MIKKGKETFSGYNKPKKTAKKAVAKPAKKGMKSGY